MSRYGVIFDGIWLGKTGATIARFGGPTAQVLAFYLMKNPDDNMIGLYRAKLGVMEQRIQTLDRNALEEAWIALARADFASYDLETNHVWVHNLAAFRMSLRFDPTTPADKRVISAQKLYEQAEPNPFLEPFFRKYRKALHLSKRRRYRGPRNLLGRSFEDPLKPGSDSRIRNQIAVTGDQIDQDPRALARVKSVRFEEVRPHLLSAAHGLLEAQADLPDSDLADELKLVAAKLGANYNGRRIQQIVDAARGTRQKRAHD